MNPDLRYALIVTLYVTLGVSGELLLSRAMRRMPDGKRPLQVLRYVVTTPLALIGTALLTLNFGMLLALLSKLDVSLIVPSHAARPTRAVSAKSAVTTTNGAKRMVSPVRPPRAVPCAGR